MVEIASVLLCFISHVELYKLSMANKIKVLLLTRWPAILPASGEAEYAFAKLILTKSQDGVSVGEQAVGGVRGHCKVSSEAFDAGRGPSGPGPTWSGRAANGYNNGCVVVLECRRRHALAGLECCA